MIANKTISLAMLLVFLIMVSVALSFWQKGTGGSQIDQDLFVLDDIDRIDRVVISRGGEVIDCRAFPTGFMVNGQFPMDENLLTLLAAVLQQVRVQRPLTGQEKQEAWQRMQEAGSHLQVYDGEQILTSFWTGGDDAKQHSYFATEDGQVYLVHLPGYTSYVSGLFELPLRDWRSRTIFLNTWRSLLSFSYQDHSEPDNNFEINYRDPFFSVSGIHRLDSNRVMNYLQDLVTLRASSVVDTVFEGKPWLELSTTDIDPMKNLSLVLYGDTAQSTMLGRAGEHYFTFRTVSLLAIIKNAEYFENVE